RSVRGRRRSPDAATSVGSRQVARTALSAGCREPPFRRRPFVSSIPRRNDEERTPPSYDGSRWGAPAQALLRLVAVAVWLSLLMRLLSTALPGSRSGVGAWIRGTDLASSFLSQTAALFGSCLLILLVVFTLAERTLGYAYRLIAVATGGGILMLVMLALADPMGPDPEASLVLGLSCLTLSTASAMVAMN